MLSILPQKETVMVKYVLSSAIPIICALTRGKVIFEEIIRLYGRQN